MIDRFLDLGDLWREFGLGISLAHFLLQDSLQRFVQ